MAHNCEIWFASDSAAVDNTGRMEEVLADPNVTMNRSIRGA
jgi:hypothetical protein